MSCRNTHWILWMLAIVACLLLLQSGHRTDLGLAITAVAVLWYVIVPAFRAG